MQENWKSSISINPEIRFGKPCINKTRIAVEDILGWLASEMTMEEITEDFPEITRQDILAALAFAAHREANAKIVIAA